MMKKFIAMILAICSFGIMMPTVSAENTESIRVFIEGTLITPRDARGNIVQPLLIDGTTFLPVRAIGEAFGRTVEWDSAGQNVFVGTRPARVPARGNSTNIRVFIDGELITPRDSKGAIVQPFIRNGTTFLPIRAIGEAFGKAVHWDSRNSSVFVGRGTFVIRSDGQRHIVTMADILALSPHAVIASPRGQTRHYTGVSLAAIFERIGVNHVGATTAVFASEDGFSASLTIAEALDAGNTFIVIEQDNQPLGTIETGGRGPFMSVVAQDPFANRFVRYLTEITLS